jgi:PAS domain S-box-containing protein
MLERNRSLSTRVISILVLATTIVLTVYAVLATEVYRRRELGKMHVRLSAATEQLQTAIGSALWNFDTTQIDKVLDGGMKDQCIAGIVVKAGAKVYARGRNPQWEPTALEPAGSLAGLLSQQQPVFYAGQKLGTVTLFATTQFLNEELIHAMVMFGGSILLLDLLIVYIMYTIFKRIVLEPLKNLEKYAVAISNGDSSATLPGKLSFIGEMEVLRSSLAKMVALLGSRCDDLQQEALRFRESEERFRTLVNTIPDLIWLKDADGIYLSCNEVFERFFGAGKSAVIGKTDFDLVERGLAEYFRHNDLKAMNLGKGKLLRYEQLLINAADGCPTWIETTKTPTYDSAGRIFGVLGVGHDITDRKQAEEDNARLEDQLRQSQKLESIGRLAGGVAHDFNNMLTVILGHANLALLNLDPSQQLYVDLEQIRKAGERAADLTRQLLTFARRQTVAPKQLELNAAVEGMLAMLRRLIGENILLTWHPGPELLPILIDPTQIDQILANLCINAHDAISDVGRISIETGKCSIDERYCGTEADACPGEYVRLTVSDDGCGIEKKNLPQIFEPFFTTKKVGEGTGLGLSTVYGIVRQNNGFINVHSEPGAGTTFNIYLPLSLGQEKPSEVETAAQTAQRGHETILLVEDEPAILNITAQMLSNQGYTVLSANAAHDAVRLARGYDSPIHLLMTDVIMPDMNGLDLARQIRLLYPQVKSLFMSGYTSDIIAPHGVLEEGVHFIQKPFSLLDMATKVREVLSCG